MFSNISTQSAAKWTIHIFQKVEMIMHCVRAQAKIAACTHSLIQLIHLIKALRNERINSQKKIFTKWVNSFLDKVSGQLTKI